MPPRYELRLLGGFELTCGGTVAVLPSRRSAALLACVAVEAGAARAWLAEVLWAGLDAAASRRNLRRELARLREAGLGDVLAAGAEHVTLARDVVCDVQTLLQACASGDPAAAVAAWRGPLLEGFLLAEASEFDAWLARQRAVLASRWREAAAAQADRLERAGATRDALELLGRLREHDPLHEPYHSAAMRLHHRAGEPAAALAVYEQCVRILREEADTAPTPATTALAQRIRAAATLAPIVSRSTRALPPSLDASLVGRDAEAVIVRGSQAAVLLVLGEAGVGKSRLVQDCLRAPATLACACDPDSRQAALHPIAEALRAALQSPRRAERVAALPAEVLREAARLLPALAPGEHRSAAADADAGPAESRRDRFFDALGDVIDRAAGTDGVLWIDDLQWADDATLELLARLAHRRAAEPALHTRIIVAARTPEISLHDAAAALLRRLERARLLERLTLQPFELPQTLELVRQLSGTAGGVLFAQRLQRATGGNPYHLFETLRFLFDADELCVDADGTWVTRYDDATADYAELPVPPTLADTVIERAERLPAEARRLLDVAALCRSGFTLRQLRPAAGLDDWQALEALEAVLKLRLFTDAPANGDAAGAPGYRFVHGLAREAVVQVLNAERRRLIHDRLADVLVAESGAADHIAWHLEEAGRAVEAVPWRLAAAAESRRLFAWRGALAHLLLADAATTVPDEKLSIVRDRWEVARNLLDLTAQQAAACDLERLARDSQREDWRLEALLWQADLAQIRKQPAAAIEPLRRAVDDGLFARHAPGLLARAAAALGSLLLASGQLAAAAEVLERADVDAVGDDDRATLLAARANAARLAGDPARAQPLLRRAIALMKSPQRLEARLQAQNLLAHTQHMLGDASAARATLEATLGDAERAQLTSALRTVLPNLVTLCSIDGQFVQAQAFLQRGMQALRFVDHPAVRAMLSARLAELRLRSGDLGGALAAARQSMTEYEANGGGTQDHAPWVMAAQIHRHAGDAEGASRLFAALEQSPARLPGPGAQAFVRMKQLALRVEQATPADALAIADELARIRVAPDHAYRACETDYWRAHALLRAGSADAASALADVLPAGELGLFLEEASLLALRLSCGVALGRVDPALVEAAVAELAKAAPLPALELAHVLVDAQRRLGRRDAAAGMQRDLDDRVDRLAGTLSATPELAAGLRRCWRSTPASTLDGAAPELRPAVPTTARARRAR